MLLYRVSRRDGYILVDGGGGAGIDPTVVECNDPDELSTDNEPWQSDR